MKIKISNYSEGIHYFELSKTAKDLEIDDIFSGDVIVNCKMDKSLSQIVLDCTVKAIIEAECDRCNDEFEMELETKFELIYLVSDTEKESDNISLKYINSETDKIDISNEVRDYCLLANPLKKLCSDDCKGLCFKCGANLNNTECGCDRDKVDSVWEPLLKLKDKLN